MTQRYMMTLVLAITRVSMSMKNLYGKILVFMYDN